MKKTVILLFIVCNIYLIKAQQIVFTTENSSSEHVFWKATTQTPFVFENITDSLNKYATTTGINKGPISISHSGNYYIFQSERFANNIGGYEAITICKTDFSAFEVPKDEVGNAFHSEGIMQVSNDGKTILFVQGGGTHSRDIYKITKGATFWSNPIELTGSITAFNYFLSPYLSYDETKILFESSNETYPNTTIQKINLDGSGLSTITKISNISGASQVKSPAYDAAGNIYFECETDAERVWKINSTGGSPSIIKNGFTNDNSPITLPDGKIASLYLPNSTHQIKIMDATGLNDFIASSVLFTEVLDIGISAGGGNTTTGLFDQIDQNSFVSIYPNPNAGLFSLALNISGNVQVSIYNSIGEKVYTHLFTNWNGSNQFNLTSLQAGIYFVQVENEGALLTQKIFINK